jgi:hypothetical protein
MKEKTKNVMLSGDPLRKAQRRFFPGGEMKIIRLFAVLWFFAAVPAFAAQPGGLKELYVYPSFQYFTWKELSNGRQILKETGPLFGIGAAVAVEGLKLDRGGSLTIRGKAELFGSVVDYDGETLPPNILPVNSDVVYFGAKNEIDLGWRYSTGNFSVEPFSGIGFRWWRRNLQNSATRDAKGNIVQVRGYEEEWRSLYSRVGLRGYYIVSKDIRIFAEAGAKYPFDTENRVDFPGIGDVSVGPGGEWSAFAEIGAKYKWFRPSIFYEGFRYSGSPVDAASRLFQPKSESDIIGVNLGVAFR